MSLLSPKLRIALTPGRVALASAGGYRDAVVAVPGWAGVLETLAGLLAEAGLKGRASVTLSHHFAPVHLLPAPPVTLKPLEMQGWIRDHLARQFGEAAREWRVIWQPAPPGRAFLASSLAPQTLAELEAVIEAASLKMDAIQPWLVPAWNRQRRKLERGHAWFALAEPERLTLARLADGNVLALRSVLMQGDALSSLSDLLKREALLAGEEQPAPVWIDSVLPALDWRRLEAGRQVHPPAGGREALASMLAA